jgi:hypothetical protein
MARPKIASSKNVFGRAVHDFKTRFSLRTILEFQMYHKRNDSQNKTPRGLQ